MCTSIEARAAADALDQRALADLDALGAQALQHHLRQLRIVLAERLQRLEHGDAAAEPQMGLGQLQADRAAADDDQMVELVAVVEDGLVGEVGHVVEAGDRRDGRRGAGGDDEAARLDALSPASTVSRLMNWAAAWITLTPRPVKRSTESLGAMAAMTPWTWSCTPR